MILKTLVEEARKVLEGDIERNGAVLLRQKRSTAVLKVISNVTIDEIRSMVINQLVEEFEKDAMIHSLDRLP